jgi:hypothetical protein
MTQVLSFKRRSGKLSGGKCVHSVSNSEDQPIRRGMQDQAHLVAGNGLRQLVRSEAS